jgi:peptidoglycan/xylan/chitin deacetylase (PgdA/CDA1 family)
MERAVIAFLLLVTPVFAQDSKEYCAYVQKDAAAQATQLQTPQAVAGVTQPNTGTAFQVYSGVQGSLADYHRGHLMREAARTNCGLYASTEDAQQAVQYAQASLESAALRHRVELDDVALRQIEKLIDRNTILVSAQSATRLSLYSLQAAKARLVADKAQSERLLSATFVPDLSPVPLSKLVEQKQADEVTNQSAQANVSRVQNWDLRWEVGYHKTPSGGTTLPTPSGPYGGFNFLYNLGGKKTNRLLDESVAAYSAWKKEANSDVVSSADTLHQQLMHALDVEDGRRVELTAQVKSLDTNLLTVGDGSTSVAITYLNQLQGDRVMLEVDEKDSEFRVESIRAYLAHNWGAEKTSGVEGTVSLTFDDGFQSAFNASGILDAAGLHATYYIITHALGASEYMTADEVKLLAARGNQIGAHTRTHPHLPTLTLAQQESEIEGSKEDLKQLGIDATAFAYPFGEHDENSAIALHEAGFETARTTDSRMDGSDPYRLQGFSINNKTTVESVIAAIEHARRNGTHLILVWHRIDEKDDNPINWRSEQLKEVVDYIVQNHVKVVPVTK